MARRPVWPHNGLICTGETYKSVVKITFAKGEEVRLATVTALDEYPRQGAPPFTSSSGRVAAVLLVRVDRARMAPSERRVRR